MMAMSAKRFDLERRYTPEEFEALPQFNELYELVEGRLVKKPMPGDEHGTIARIIMKRYDRLDPDEKLGKLWSATTFDVGTGWMPLPDLGFIVAERVPPKSPRSVKGVPDLVIEILSPTDLRSKPERELVAHKIKEWQKVGVRIIWAINPQKQLVEVYHPEPPNPVRVLTSQDELDGAGVIPGFKLRVSDLFA
ncbi:MAG: Uma2 family endonuclease [Chloroflexi bacterium]|nr:Uma2 family endonuclease [Chloroflexota bacterium]